jgi:hypothetical protein
MYITAKGCPTGYFPINTKWGGESTLSGILPGGGLRGLNYFRPNFAMARGNYPGGGHSWNSMGRMGDDVSADPTMLGLGIGALALGMFLFGRKHPKKARRPGRLRRALRELRA